MLELRGPVRVIDLVDKTRYWYILEHVGHGIEWVVAHKTAATLLGG